ncbi:MAG: hypothetical protein GQ540_03225 [Lutibacter sp.]|uniref:hypothetical protein n=1 Tax=Lutibacter sp. TaxID=1925666 RepID=UPI0019E75A28|nr:hypothetical protein [Lutibacter sp.]NOR27523.1 hypothetical protein [Lutibacter sp.]
MDCSCNVSNSYDDCESRWGCCERKARVFHECYECGCEIAYGDTYWFHTLFGEDTISNFKYCNDCQNITWQFFKNGWMFGDIWDSLECYFDENWSEDLPSSCIIKLPKGVRDKVCDMLEKIHKNCLETENKYASDMYKRV